MPVWIIDRDNGLMPGVPLCPWRDEDDEKCREPMTQYQSPNQKCGISVTSQSKGANQTCGQAIAWYCQECGYTACDDCAYGNWDRP